MWAVPQLGSPIGQEKTELSPALQGHLLPSAEVYYRRYISASSSDAPAPAFERKQRGLPNAVCGAFSETRDERLSSGCLILFVFIRLFENLIELWRKVHEGASALNLAARRLFWPILIIIWPRNNRGKNRGPQR